RGSQKTFPIVPAVLIENAIKYGEKGTRIYVDIEAREQAAVFKVQNTTKELIDPIRCFERGVRCSTNVEGGGFGLYIAREIVIAHGGSIECIPGGGVVTMRAEFPLRDVHRSWSAQ